MKENEVPQDESPISKKGSTELVYAVDENGKMTAVQSKGWEPKSVIQYENLEQLNQRTEEAREKAMKGEWSPVVYYMELHKMDWQTLSAYMKSWTFFIKRHKNPSVFKKLSDKTLQKYARIFEVSVDDLKNFKG